MWVFALILDIQQEQIVGHQVKPLVMTLQPAIALSSFLELHMIHSTLSRPLVVVQLKLLLVLSVSLDGWYMSCLLYSFQIFRSGHGRHSSRKRVHKHSWKRPASKFAVLSYGNRKKGGSVHVRTKLSILFF